MTQPLTRLKVSGSFTVFADSVSDAEVKARKALGGIVGDRRCDYTMTMSSHRYMPSQSAFIEWDIDWTLR